MSRTVGRAVVIGTVSLDLVAASPTATVADAAVGNSGANIAVRLAHLGWEVVFVTLLGYDDAADMVLRDLERWGVRTGAVVRRRGYATPLVFQVADVDGGGAASLLLACPRCKRERGYRLELPSAAETPDGLGQEVTDADLVVVDIADATSAMLVKAARGLVWYEASMTEARSDELRTLASMSDVVKVSEEEAGHYADAIRGEHGPRWVRMLTAGRRGVRYALRNEDGWSAWSIVPALEDVEVVDALGAGDAFTAAVAHHFAAGGWGAPPDDASVAAALRIGNTQAAQACCAVGARGDMRPPGTSSPWIETGVLFQCARCGPVVRDGGAWQR